MKEPLSLLDYLKSVLDPRVKAVPLRELLEEGGSGRVDVPASSRDAVRGGRPGLSGDSGRGRGARAPGADRAPGAGDPGQVERRDAEGSPEHRPELRIAIKDAGGEEESAGVGPDAGRPDGGGRGPVPWRSLLTVFVLLVAQSALEPPGRQVGAGVWLYAAGLTLGVWAMFAGELKPLLPGRVRRGGAVEDFHVHSRLLWAALPVLLLAFFFLGGNEFNVINLAFWLGGLGLIAAGLWKAGEGRGSHWSSWVERLKPPYRFEISAYHIIFLLTAALLLYFRFYRLSEVPSQMFSDHAEKLQDVQDVLNGETRIFFPRNTGREFVQMYLTAFTARYLGFDLTFMALKMGTALAGLATLPYIYLLGVELGSRRVGWFAAVLAGTSYWLNVITRVALRFSLYPLFAAPTLYYVVRGLRRRNRNDFILAGIFLGLGLHGYSPFRFVPILVVLLVLLYILHHRERGTASRALWHLSIAAGVSFVVFLPLLRFMTESDANMSIVMYRSLTRVSSLESEIPGSPVGILAANMWRAMIMFAWDNGTTWVHSVVGRPALEIVSAVFFYLGYFLLLFRYIARRRWEDGFLLISVPMLVLPSAMSLAFPAENPSLNRTAGAVVPVFLTAGIAFDAFMQSIERWLGGRAGAFAAWGIAGTLLLFSGVSNHHLVFERYDSDFTRSAWNTTELGAVIRNFADSIGDEDQAWVIPWPHWVDTRLVGINAGVGTDAGVGSAGEPIRDYAIPRERLQETLQAPSPKLFLLHPEDVETLAALNQLYPDGWDRLYGSEIPGKDFIIYTVPAGSGSLP